jgi:Flp pilus assembly protein CpaB
MTTTHPVRRIACAVGLAGLAALFAHWHLIELGKEIRPNPYNYCPVVVATKAMPAGTVITYDNIAQRPVPYSLPVPK